MNESSKTRTRRVIKIALLIPIFLISALCLEQAKHGTPGLYFVVMICTGLMFGIYNYKPKPTAVERAVEEERE